MLHAWWLAVPIIGVASQPGSLVAELANITLLYPQVVEARPARIAPTTSTTVELALGDASAVTVMKCAGSGAHSSMRCTLRALSLYRSPR
jgi:arabinose-5-phosphate isomerase